MNTQFDQYMESKIPNYKTKLEINQIIQLKQLFDIYANALQAEQFCFNRSLNQSGVDYLNDYEKNSQRRVAAQNNLNIAINNIISPSQTIEEPSFRR